MPQPIDPNTEILRVSAAERIQQIADRLSLQAQARHATAAAEQRLDIETQVQRTNQKTEQVDEELRRRNPFMGRRQHPDHSEEGAETKHGAEHDGGEHREPPVPPVIPEEHRLDITI